MDVLGHDGDTLGVNGTLVRVIEEIDEVRFRGLVEGTDSSRLEAVVRAVVLRDLADETLKISRFLQLLNKICERERERERERE